MKPIIKQSLGQPNSHRVGVGLLLGFLLLPVLFLVLTESDSYQLAILNLQLSIRTYRLSPVLKAVGASENSGRNLTSLSLAQNDSIVDKEIANLTSTFQEKQGRKIDTGIGVAELYPDLMEKEIVEDKSIIVTETANLAEEENKITLGDRILAESKIFCDWSEPRSDTCSILGDVRVLGKLSTILLASSSKNSTLKIRPYARKWETPVMERINELSLKTEPDTKLIPPCSVNHTVPAVIFSTGGFLGNVFHDFTDVLVPLFATSHHFQGEVQFLATDFNPNWLHKYKPILAQLSRYEIIDMDSDDRVHCFPETHIGLNSNKVFGMDPSKTPNGYTMADFKRTLRASFSLNRESVPKIIAKRSKRKPRLMIILRKGSRAIKNAKEVIRMARAVGYKVIAVSPEDTKDLSRFARVVNSCDVMVGVHGAGLANMVFLPTNATVVQVVPWGGLKWACRHDFGEPAPDMGLNYVEYEIKEEESSLIEEYPRDHAVFTDPASIQKQGWNMLWYIFLDKQKVKLDVGRFRGVLLEIYHTLKQ